MSYRIYTGDEITKKEIKQIKSILKGYQHKGEQIEYNKKAKNINKLSIWYDSFPKEMKLVLSDDWYLFLSEKDSYVTLLDWYSKKGSEITFNRSLDMLKALKTILLQNRGKIFYADMIHTTSYKLYNILLKKGLLEEISHDCYPTLNGQKEIQNVIDELDKISNPSTLAEVLETYETELSGYLQYFYHTICFKPTDSFYEKYEKTLRQKS